MNCVIIPETQHKHLTTIQGPTHCLVTSLLFIVIRISESLLLNITEVAHDGIKLLASNSNIVTVHNFPILNPQAPDLGEITIVCSISSDESCDYCKCLGSICINSKVGCRTKKGHVSQAVRVEITSILVTDSIVPLTCICVITLHPFAMCLSILELCKHVNCRQVRCCCSSRSPFLANLSMERPIVRWPRRAMSITNFNISNYQF